jgi:hypothetical protein
VGLGAKNMLNLVGERESLRSLDRGWADLALLREFKEISLQATANKSWASSGLLDKCRPQA